MGLVSTMKKDTPPPAYTAQKAWTSILQRIIKANCLEHYYPCVDAVKLNDDDFATISKELQISRELAYELAPLSLYEIIFHVDDSGSMLFEENGERVEDLKFVLGKLAPVVTRLSSTGIYIRFMNSNVQGNNVKSSHEVEQIIGQVSFSGLTPLGASFETKIVNHFMSKNMQKPILTIILTDGTPVGEPRNHFANVVMNVKRQFRKGDIAIQIAQLGKDVKAQEFLSELDNHAVIGDVIDATSYYELEAQEFKLKGVDLTPEMWLLKLCLGAIDSEIDKQD